MSETGEQPKIIVDSDWKSQAQAEKERLTEQEAARPAKGAAGADPQGMPPADMRTLVGVLATQALMYLGGFPDPETGRAIVALDYARHYIDLLGVLEEKTKGNLSADEAQEIKEVLHELRTRYVRLSGYVEESRKGDAGQAPGGEAPGETPGGGPGQKSGGPQVST
ncbi:MAG: DUF1844 domain-containing protein [Phycisphaerales bacterium]|nr:MAG: DUF1844 domain-containing protein [Phycisphaerales bacterium]